MHAALNGSPAKSCKGKAAMRVFTYTSAHARILFGAGRAADLADEVRLLGCRRALVVTTPEQRDLGESLVAVLGNLAAAYFDGATMHTPVEVTDRAMDKLRNSDVDCLIAAGGGSAVGLSKALAARTGLPQIAIPTTYAGSEVTPILGETQGGRKTTRRAPEILPRVVIYDVDLTLSLPASLSASSGLNAIAHAVEALYAKDRNPIASLIAEDGIRALGGSLLEIAKNPRDLDARAEAQYGAWLCGTCLGTVGMALHHKICHVLGGTFDLPHALTHSVVLPYVLAYNAHAASGAVAGVARALSSGPEPWQHLYQMLERLGLPTSLRALGMPADKLDVTADLVLQQAYWNPRPVERESLLRLLGAAYEGVPPSPDMSF
ncbi:iron-containing alcohol dehydrogenase [Caballeronia hypogeia]|uniref:Iron-containing alcohol dehydrogenase n=1 Tax=Caballeronia hypogeia TaxID=1777140 RepID=A0A158CVT7_9BURK|nr:maleylacetate reductase [Caballeronia hypogeia]SAK86454.1 iron-containing alcohol dehydrogenase [Caballeronia hypogeia]